MPAGYGVSASAEVIRQIHLHLCGSLERHGIQVRIKLRQQPEAVSFHQWRILGPGLVVGKPFFRCQAGHAHINAGLVPIAIRVGGPDLSESGDGWIEQDHVNAVVIRSHFGAQLSERPAFHRLRGQSNLPDSRRGCSRPEFLNGLQVVVFRS